MKRLFVLTAFLLLAAPLTAQDFPQGIPFRMAGMDKPAIVTREANGIPHVFALTKHDLYFANGWLHASDRFFQMDTLRHIGSGTFAEMVGSPALSTDVQLRTFGLRRAAETSLPVQSATTKGVLAAYTQGVNQWLQTHGLPVEYGLLGISSVDPWSDVDTLTIGKLLAFQLSFDLSDDIDRTTALISYETVGKIAGFNGQALFADLYRTAGFDPAATIPDATGGVQIGATSAAPVDTSWIRPETIDLLNRWIEETKDMPIMASFHAENHAGSNEWAIAPSHSTTGGALLANDPHLPLTTPSTFYPVSLHLLGGTNVNGMSFPGTPGVIQGQNEHLTWGSTVHPMDVTDAYQEQIVPDASSPSGLSSIYKGQKEKIQIVPQLFRIRIGSNLLTADPGGPVPPATLIVPRHGPVISLDAAHGTAVTVQYTGLYPTHEVEALLGFDDAKTLDDFKAALQFFDFGSQNWAVADTAGNIAYFTSAELPIREDLQAGTVNGTPPYFIRNGTGGNEWMAIAHPQPNQATPFEILPYSEMPQVINPTFGWFVNANNDPTGQTRDNNPLNTPRAGGGILYLNPGYSSMRAGRIEQMVKAKLANGGKISPDDMKAMQADTVLLDAQVFVPLITQALKNAQASANPVLASFAASPAVVSAVTRLSKWDFSSPTGIPQGYDASEKTGDKNGVLSTPSQTEVDNSIGATIYSLWRGQFIKNTIDVPIDKIGGIPKPGGEIALSALRNLLDTYSTTGGVGLSGISFFNVPGVTSAGDRRDILILKSIGDALTLAASDAFKPAFGGSTDQANYQWGKLHRIVFTHYIGFESIGDLAGPIPPSLPGLPGISRQGGFETVDAATHNVRASTVNGFMFSSGPNRRYVGDAQKSGINGQSALPGGVSGTPGTALSSNLLMLWLTNDTFEVKTDSSPRIPWLR